MSFNSNINITFICCFNKNFSLKHLFFSLPSYFFTYHSDFCLLNIESFLTFHLVYEFIVFFRMLGMLVNVNKLMHMPCHGSHASRITTKGTFLTKSSLMPPMKLMPEERRDYLNIRLTNFSELFSEFPPD